MRLIEWTGACKRDYRRIKANPRHQDADDLLDTVVSMLAMDKK